MLAVRALRRIDDGAHVEVLSLIDELVAMGGGRPATAPTVSADNPRRAPR